MISALLSIVSAACAVFCAALLRYWTRRALEYKRRWRQALALVEAQAVYLHTLEDARDYGPSYAPEDAAIARRQVTLLQEAMVADAERIAARHFLRKRERAS